MTDREDVLISTKGEFQPLEPKPVTRQRTFIVLAVLVAALAVSTIVLGVKYSQAQSNQASTCSPPSPVLSADLQQRIAGFMDTTVDPCDDFEKFVCGGFHKTYVLPPGVSTYITSFSQIGNSTNTQVLDILKNGNVPVLSPAFASCTRDLVTPPKTDNFNWLVSTWFPLFRTVDTGATYLFGAYGQARRHSLVDGFIGRFDYGPNDDAVWEVGVFQGAGQIRNTTAPYAAMLQQLNVVEPIANITDAAIQLLALDTLMNEGECMGDPVEMTRAEFGSFGGLPMETYLTGWGDATISGGSRGAGNGMMSITVLTPDCFTMMGPIVTSIYAGTHTITPRAFRHWLMIRSIVNLLPLMPTAYTTAWNTQLVAGDHLLAAKHKDIRAAIKEKHREMRRKRSARYGSGIISSPEPEIQTLQDLMDKLTENGGSLGITPAERSCMTNFNDLVPDLIAHAWIYQYFPDANRQAVIPLVETVYKKMGERLAHVTWLDDQTRAEAVKKWTYITRNVAYNTNWQTFAAFITGTLYLRDVTSIFAYSAGEDAKLWDTYIDRNSFPTREYYTQNAFYFPMANSINMIAGLLLEPFFSGAYPPLLNMASYGWVIGHEITHAFDPHGAQYNGTGCHVNWWTQQAQIEFSKRLQCLVDQYNTFPVYDIHVDGLKTLGENTADLGGLSIAWPAYKDLETVPQLLPGYSNDQLFWIWAGQAWCQASTEAAARRQIVVDVHSPGRYRVLGPMSNLKEFGQTWNCPATSFMGRSATDKQCRVWNL